MAGGSAMKIAVYAISKNEEAFVRTFCESAKDADLIVLADTGSTDKTVDLATECGAVVHDIHISPWRFDKARDAALALVPKDIDICISLDLDEKLEPGWREEVERCWRSETTRMRYLFDWGSGVVFYSDKIHSRHGYHWHHPCHEALRADARIQESWVHTDKLLVTHHPDPTKSRGQYLSLLAMSVQEDPHCPRNAFYYARELTFYRQHEPAIQALQNYLDNPRATWASERSAAMRLIGQSYGALGNHSEALRWCRLACAESPGEIEPWVALAQQSHDQQDWLSCYTACLKAMSITSYAKTYLSDPEARGSKVFDLAALSSYNLGRFEEALQYGERAAQMSPEDTRIVQNMVWYRAALGGTTE